LRVASDLQQLKKDNIEALSAKLLEIQTLSARLLDTRNSRADVETVVAELQDISGCSLSFIFGCKLAAQARIRPVVAAGKLPASLDQVKLPLVRRLYITNRML
jgi:hypothetical protein